MRNIRSWRGTPRTLGPSTGRSISWTTARTQATLRMSLMMMMKMMALVPPRRKRMMIQQQVRAFAICIWIFAWHIVQWNGPYSLHKMKWPNPMDHFHYSSCANICALFSLYGWFIGIGRSQWLIELSRTLIYQLHHALNLYFFLLHFEIAEAKKIADQAMKDPMSLVNNVGALKFWWITSLTDCSCWFIIMEGKQLDSCDCAGNLCSTSTENWKYNYLLHCSVLEVPKNFLESLFPK